MKENSDLKKLFQEADRFIIVDKKGKEQTLERLYEETIEGGTSITASFSELVLSQLRYMEKGIWLADAAVNILFILILLLLRYYLSLNLKYLLMLYYNDIHILVVSYFLHLQMLYLIALLLVVFELLFHLNFL